MSKHYLSVNYDGTIFEWSKDSKEGFVKHTNSAGKESFRKYFNKGVEGKLMWLNSKKNPNLHNREEVEVVLKAEDDTYYLNFVVYGQDNFVDIYTEKLITYLPKLEKGTVYNINNWFIKKGDTVNGNVAERNVKGITVKIAGTKIEPALTYQTDENPKGDIPALVWKEKQGKSIPTAASKEAKSDYLYEVLQANIERLKYDGNQADATSTPQQPSPAPQQASEPQPQVAAKPKSDNLPF